MKYVVKNRKYSLHRLWRAEQGFLSVDVLLLTLVIVSAALSYALLSNINNAQQNGAYRITAVFLAQQYLNESEHNIINGMAINGDNDIKESISLNGQIFEVDRQIDNINDNIQQYRIKVEVRWRYENAVQSEYQERQIVAR